MTTPAIATRPACERCGSRLTRAIFGAPVGVYECAQCGHSTAAAVATTPCARCTQPVPQGVRRCPSCGFAPGDASTPAAPQPATGPRRAALERDFQRLPSTPTRSVRTTARVLVDVLEEFAANTRKAATLGESIDGRSARSRYAENCAPLRPLLRTLGDRLAILLDVDAEHVPQHIAAIRAELAKLEERK